MIITLAENAAPENAENAEADNTENTEAENTDAAEAQATEATEAENAEAEATEAETQPRPRRAKAIRFEKCMMVRDLAGSGLQRRPGRSAKIAKLLRRNGPRASARNIRPSTARPEIKFFISSQKHSSSTSEGCCASKFQGPNSSLRKGTVFLGSGGETE